MKVAIPKETHPKETRIPMIPADVEKLVKRGAQIVIESGLGTALHLPDEAYTKAGATVETDRQKLLASADMVLRLRLPPLEDIDQLQAGTIHVSYLDPFFNQPLIEKLVDRDINAVCMEMIPRTTLAQKMDALSSQASLGGYAAVMLAAERLEKAFPMMMTPAGTLAPSRVFIIGAGVAGLQAIATAKRLGARVEAFDTRPVVAEQVQSLGAKFIKIDLGEMGQTEQGYAKALTAEQIAKQQAGMAKHCALADVVITTAQLFGRKAPVIVNADMVAGMKAGSIIVDMAVETGGNVTGSEIDKEVVINGVRILGMTNLPGRVPLHASQMYSSNLRNLIEHFWDDESKSFQLNTDDEIMDGCLIAQNKTIRSNMLREHYKK
ncbi:NAD(P) transhydrogenase subunit alpha [Anaerolineales bacterium HSG25]|nr:NAD(P) transhydrogenase subunit alpha [Anaerolineales bacterium HSG25]